jgi:cytochrome c-type biogenesis protein CcsB
MSVTPEYLENEFNKAPLLKRLSLFDWLWALMTMAGGILAYHLYSSLMDSYEVGILFGTAIGLVLFGWAWKPMRALSLIVALISLLSVSLYGDDLARGESSFFLKFLISSQSAIMWMSALYVMATLAYWFALAVGSEFTGRVGTALTWSGSVMGSVGLMVRWRESYLMGADIGHIPVSNLYEVFILFAVITALLYLFYERRYNNRAMGAFALTVISAAVGFLLWYTFERGAHEIQPLVPALQSYWMKIHVPANFVGYGAFALAAMLGVAYLIKDYTGTPEGRRAFFVSLGIVFIVGLVGTLSGEYRSTGQLNTINILVALLKSTLMLSVWALFLWVIAREKVIERLPSLELLDDIMYKAIALGFAFFTVATVLGAMWAAEAWGGYWSWDPKETWALIVWLNYAAWLHLRLTKGWRGKPLAWWAIIGLFITLFAFIGVNMFLSGLHSYGQL